MQISLPTYAILWSIRAKTKDIKLSNVQRRKLNVEVRMKNRTVDSTRLGSPKT